MKNSDITDPLFKIAVEAIDEGRITELQDLIAEHPELIKERLITFEEGYFKDPYLIYFIADNPIRNGKLALDITDITRLLIKEVKRRSKENWKEQLNYTLGLVVTGSIPRECGVQIELADLLIDGGASPGGALGALAHGNTDAAKHLVKRGGELQLGTAVGLKYSKKDILRLAANASDSEKTTALTVAAFYGDAEMISFLLSNGFKPDGYPDNKEGFHSHATPLHQAVYSGSLGAVKHLVKAGARLDRKDKIFGGTPLGWAKHMQTEAIDAEIKTKYKEIEIYLFSKE